MLLLSCRRLVHLGSQGAAGSSVGNGARRGSRDNMRSCARTTTVLRLTDRLGKGAVSISCNCSIVLDFIRGFSLCIGFARIRLCLPFCGDCLVDLFASSVRFGLFIPLCFSIWTNTHSSKATFTC